jgi:uncharacterized cupredoxin-like copper-binding protein
MAPDIRPAVAWAAIVCLITLAAGCGGGSSDAAHGPTIQVSERDFKIDAPSHIAAGRSSFAVDNRGPIRHELIVAHQAEGGLPIDADGIDVDEEGLERSEVAELEPQEPGVHTIRLNLKPGRYVLLCNMSGHYKGGMHAEMVVR